MDIQGFEYQALMGMERLLRDNSQIQLLLEYFPSGLEAAGYGVKKLLALLTEHELSIYFISTRGTLVALEGKEPPLNSMGYTNLYTRRCKSVCACCDQKCSINSKYLL